MYWFERMAEMSSSLTQSGVLVNSLQNLIKKVGDGSIHTELGYVGPTIAVPDTVTSQPIPVSTQ